MAVCLSLQTTLCTYLFNEDQFTVSETYGILICLKSVMFLHMIAVIIMSILYYKLLTNVTHKKPTVPPNKYTTILCYTLKNEQMTEI